MSNIYHDVNDAVNRIYMRDSDLNAIYVTGTSVPIDTAVGYAKGCLFVDTDVAGWTAQLYVNKGTAASAEFSLNTQAA